MTQVPLEWRVIAERIAETVNRKLADVYARIEAMESRLKMLEREVEALRSRTIESVVKGVLSVKTEEIVDAVAKRGAASLDSAVARIESIASTIREAVEGIKDVVTRMERISSEIQRASARIPTQVTIDESAVVGAISRYLEPMVSSLSSIGRKLDEVSKMVESVATQLAEIGMVAKNALAYSKETYEMIKKRIEEVEAEEAESEEEGEE